MSRTFRSPIRGLFLLGSPSHIAWLVIAVVVDTVNREILRLTRPNIGNEIRKVSPALANGDSSRSVIFIAVMARVRTSLRHCKPYSVFGRHNATDGGTVLNSTAIHGHDFALKAPATFNCPIPEASSTNDLFSPAIAAAEPPNAVLPVWINIISGSLNNDQALETVAY